MLSIETLFKNNFCGTSICISKVDNLRPLPKIFFDFSIHEVLEDSTLAYCISPMVKRKDYHCKLENGCDFYSTLQIVNCLRCTKKCEFQ